MEIIRGLMEETDRVYPVSSSALAGSTALMPTTTNLWVMEVDDGRGDGTDDIS